MLKITWLSNILGPEIGNGNGKIIGFGVSSDDEELAKKSGKLKGQNLAKSQKSKGEKSKKPSKSRNLPNFNNIKAGPSFLTPDARETFNHLWLAFTKALILQYFDPESNIWIKTNTLGYAIGGVLS